MFEVKLTADWFKQAVPEPTEKNRHTQLGVHFEEVGEMVEALETDDPETANLLNQTELLLKALGDHLKRKDNVLLPQPKGCSKLLDALCDQYVTLVGCAHMEGYDIEGAIVEVNRSNYSKFEDGVPVFDKNRKIIKGKDYTKPQLKNYLTR